MQTQKSFPAIQKAFSFVKEMLDRSAMRAGDRLPSIAAMAKGAEVSPRTMSKAVALLRSDGLVRGNRRARLRVGAQSDWPGTRLSAEVEQAVWIMKRTALEKDILEGVYAQLDRLPSIKELCFRYGACFATMRKILRSMVNDRVIQLYRGAYTVAAPTSRPFQQRIVFISYLVQSTQWSALNQGQYRVLDLLEDECRRRQLRLEIVEINFFDSTDTLRALSGQAINAPALGYFFDLWWFDNAQYRRSNADLLAHLSTLKRPVAILDENGNFELPMEFSNMPLLQVFRIQGKSAGSRVARLLLGLGHRSVAFISWQHGQAYSRQRLEGIQEQFALAGNPGPVTTALNERLNEPFDVLHISGLDHRDIRRIISIDRTHAQAAEAWGYYRQYKRSKPVLALDSSKIPIIRKKMRGIMDVLNLDIDTHSRKKMCAVALKEAIDEFNRLILDRMFDRILLHTDITAWICATDGIALEALPYLRSRGISVPKDLSVVGFDNMPVAALDQRLTSFDFNARGYVHRMLAFIVRPPVPKGPHRHSIIEVDGVVIERTTVGRAPGGRPVRVIQE